MGVALVPFLLGKCGEERTGHVASPTQAFEASVILTKLTKHTRSACSLTGIRVVVAALFTSIPALGSVLVVAALFYYIAGVLTMSLLLGQLYK